MALTDLVIHETGGTDGLIIRNTPPNVVNTPGNDWTRWGSNSEPKRQNNRLETGGWAVYDTGSTLDYKMTTVWNADGATASSHSFYMYARVGTSSTTNTSYYFLRVGPNLANTIQLRRDDGTTVDTLKDYALSLSNTADITIEMSVEGVGATVTITIYVSDGVNSYSYTHDDTDSNRIISGSFFGFRDRNSGHYFDDYKVFYNATAQSLTPPPVTASVSLGSSSVSLATPAALSPSSLASSVSFGSSTVSLATPSNISPGSTTTSSALGSLTISSTAQDILINSLSYTSALPAPTIGVLSSELFPSSLTASGLFGSPAIQSSLPQDILPTPQASSASVGTPMLQASTSNDITPPSLLSPFSIGLTTVDASAPGNVTPTSVSNTVAFGTHTIALPSVSNVSPVSLVLVNVIPSPSLNRGGNPIASHIPAHYYWVGDTVALDLSVYFSDPDLDPLEFTATGIPPGLSLGLNSGVLSGTLGSF